MSLLRPATDLWHVGIVRTPITSFLTHSLKDVRVEWLPGLRPFCFIADPFGIRQNGHSFIFAEAYDYRDKKGKIVFYEFSDQMEHIRTGDVLVKPFHLSYPFLIRHDGHIYMLPEAHKSGCLTLYRAVQFPDQWEPVADILNVPAIDASIIHWQGKWWMFYSLPGKGRKAMRELYVAFSDNLTSGWQQHASNPVHVSDASARMGGTPFVSGGNLYLPTQDCSHTYGSAVSLLRVDTLTQTSFHATVARHLPPPQAFAPYTDGFHTLSTFGEWTLVDAKRIRHSAARHLINMQRRMRRVLDSK